MKRFLSSLLVPYSVAVAAAASPISGSPGMSKPLLDNIPIHSDLGSRIMSHSRSLENTASIDFTWVADYSIKFQGCNHVSQWNDAAEGTNDVRIQEKRLIRFRLCPTKSCSANSAAGCSSSYGDYIIDMNTFLNSYYQAVEHYNQYRCQATLQKCDCQNEDVDFDVEACESQCYATYGMSDICDSQDSSKGTTFLANYVGCAQLRLEQAEGQEQNGQQQTKYFIGPYCAEQGGSIYLGLFTDDTCSEFADSYKGSSTYKTLLGQSLPYSKESIITEDCLSCKEPQEYNLNGNDGQDSDRVSEMCEQIYYTAGKCESAMKSTGYLYQINENACTYISGIKVVRKDGIITQAGSNMNKTASIFIGIFVVAFVLLAAYVYFLKTKLDRVAINLAD